MYIILQYIYINMTLYNVSHTCIYQYTTLTFIYPYQTLCLPARDMFVGLQLLFDPRARQHLAADLKGRGDGASVADVRIVVRMATRGHHEAASLFSKGLKRIDMNS